MYNPQDLEIFSDGGSRGNPGPGASAFIVFNKKDLIYQKSKYLGTTTNNISEYFAVLMAVYWVSKNVKFFNKSKIRYFLDSELVVKQLKGEYKIKDQKLKKIFEKIVKIINEEKIAFDFIHIKRNGNKEADLLVNKAIDENL